MSEVISMGEGLDSVLPKLSEQRRELWAEINQLEADLLRLNDQYNDAEFRLLRGRQEFYSNQISLVEKQLDKKEAQAKELNTRIQNLTKNLDRHPSDRQ